MDDKTNAKWRFLGIGVVIGVLLGTGLGISFAKLFIKVSAALGGVFVVLAIVGIIWVYFWLKKQKEKENQG